MLRSSSTLALSLVAFAALVACPTPTPVEGEGEGEEGEGEEGEGEPVGDGDCPVVAGGNSVCDVQDAASDNAVATGAAVTLPGVVATSPSFVVDRDDQGTPTRLGVYISDDPVKKRSGILVAYTPAVTAPAVISIGDVLTVTGQADELSLDAPNTESRIDATSIVADGGSTPLAPIVVEAAALASETAGEDFEGVLVTVNNLAVESIGQFGQFTLAGGVVTDDTIFRYTALQGEVFTSITGVVGYNIFAGGGFRLLPRQASDIVSEARPTNNVTDLNDGTLTRCAFDSARDCPAVIVDAVVVSPVVFDDATNENFDRFLFWVADANNVDANGRLGPSSGVMVSVLKNNLPSSTTYTFAQDGNFGFVAGTAPEIGDVVEMVGFNTEDFAQGEFEATELNRVTTTALTPDLAVLPALFGTGGRPTSDLKGGRPDAPDGDFATGFTPPLENVAASATIEQWEGVLVELKDVTTTTACYGQVFDPDRNTQGNAFARDFSNFLVTGDVEVGDLFRLEQGFGGFFDSTLVADNANKTCANVANKCQDSRVDGQVFTTLTGVVNFSFNVHRVNPRSAADISATPGFVAQGTGNCAP